MIYTFYENRKQGNINKNFALEAWDLEESLFESNCDCKLFYLQINGFLVENGGDRN